MAEPGTPDWWLDRLYKRLRERQPLVSDYDVWYSGEHPAPLGHEKATLLLQQNDVYVPTAFSPIK